MVSLLMHICIPRPQWVKMLKTMFYTRPLHSCSTTPHHKFCHWCLHYQSQSAANARMDLMDITLNHITHPSFPKEWVWESEYEIKPTENSIHQLGTRSRYQGQGQVITSEVLRYMFIVLCCGYIISPSGFSRFIYPLSSGLRTSTGAFIWVPQYQWITLEVLGKISD